MMRRGVAMTLAETNAVIALREAGMRIEVARGLPQALAVVREMGVSLKDDDRQQMRDHWRVRLAADGPRAPRPRRF
jgi:hypothetical protein